MKKFKIWILGISLAGIFLLAYADFQSGMRNMSLPVLSAEEAWQISEERTAIGEDSAVLYVNQVQAPYETAEKRYYIPQDMEGELTEGTLSASLNSAPASAAWISDDAFGALSSAIAEEHEFQCLIYNDTQYTLVTVLFTGLPVMSIDGTMGETGTTISVLDPVLDVSGTYTAVQTNAYYNIRGNASKRFEKICYRLEFFKEDGVTSRDLSLLGMRSDNDWQLKAMYSDRSKLRDKLSIDLWNEIAAMSSTQADAGCRMEYLELIVNGEYRGLYGLVEPTDYKSLGLDKSSDIIYKAAADEWPDDSLFDASEAAQSFTCAGISIRQGGKTYTPGLWEPFRMFWNSGYEMESSEDLERLYACSDRQNLIDFALYYNAIAGMDNRFKNVIYSAVKNADGTYTLRRIPWDQNYSWGDDFETGEDKDVKNIRYHPELAEKWLNEEVFRNMLEYDGELPADMQKTWQTWRESFLTEDHWKDRAAELMDTLVSSGAFARDSRRWPDSENKEGTKEIDDYIDARFIWLDEYLQSLT